MLTLRIIQDTFAKLSTEQSKDLPDSQKLFIDVGDQGKDLKIKSYLKQGDHVLVQLQEPLEHLGKSVFFLAKHIQLEEIRAVWITNIDSDILQSKDNIKAGLIKLKGAGFNTLYPVVWHQGFLFFKSFLTNSGFNSTADQFHDVDLQIPLAGRDILAEIIEVNQALNNPFRIIPWLEFGLTVPPNAPLAKDKPNWFMKTNANETIFDKQSWLNPTHPEVQNFFVNVVTELTQNYQIDGIQLDDHFGIPTSMGFDDFTLNLFKKENPGATNPKIEPSSEDFKKWRKEKVTALLHLIFHTVKAINKDCIISISPNPLSTSIDKYLADWHTWEQDGFAEEIVLQVYRHEESFEKNMEKFKNEIDKPEVQQSRQHIPTVIGIMTGQKDKRVGLQLIKQQTKETRDRDFAGFSYFFYGSLFDLGIDGDTPESRQTEFATLLGSDRFVNG